MACSGGSDGDFSPDLQSFSIDAGAQTRIDQAAATGQNASGSYSYDAATGALSFTLDRSSFDCNIETGEPQAGMVTELTESTMVWSFPDGEGSDEDTVTWTRVDDGPLGVVGVWQAEDFALVLVLHEDGKVEVFGGFGDCGDDNADRPRNAQRCIVVTPAAFVAALDGQRSEWDGLAPEAGFSDPAGDQMGAPGADVLGMQVALSGSTLSLLTPTSAMPGGAEFRLTVQGDGGLSLQDSLQLSGGSGQLQGRAPEITAAVGADHIEWQVDLSAYVGQPGFEDIERIMVEPLEFTPDFTRIDEMDCAGLTLP